MSTLLIVESPNKAKSIRKYFPDFQVVATVGHFRDLPSDKMGVEPPEHKPEYVTMPGKQDVEKKLHAAAKTASVIYVATDPDREGEAIAAHVVNCLGNQYKNKLHRITYAEVNKKAIEAAIKAKSQINWPLVRAQEARRVVDRYVGYTVSPTLSDLIKRVNSKLPFVSAGRVQSVALKLVVERDRAISIFKPITHYGATLFLSHKGVDFTATWLPSKLQEAETIDDGEPDETGEFHHKNLITDRELPESALARTARVIVKNVDVKRVEIAPPQPLITSSFIKLMTGALKLSTKASMDAAQKLFEAGLITYHRTDSPVMGEEFTEAVRKYARFSDLPIPSTPRNYSAKAGAQEGHECLRVTDIECEVVELNDPVLERVYRLVWRITMQSQLANAVENRTRVRLENESKDIFLAAGKVEVSPGWRSLDSESNSQDSEKKKNMESEEKSEGGKEKKLPAIAEGEAPEIKNMKLDVKKTKAPASFTEKTLVAKLDQLKIGRPSTYASIIERILSQNYITRDKKLVLNSTSMGMAIVSILDGHFAFMNYEYTADMEELLDQISNKTIDYKTVVDAVYVSLMHDNNKIKTLDLPEETCNAIKNIKAATA